MRLTCVRRSAWAALLGLIAGCAVMPPASMPKREAETTNDRMQLRTSCVVASDAQLRRQQVLQDLLPNVVFTGETQPEAIDMRMAALRVPALSVAVIRGGALDWSDAWGRLTQDGAAADCDSLFQAGSLAKPVTVLAALRMAEQGRIDLDADVESQLRRYHLPAGKQSSALPVTLRTLFMHTAGITPGGYEGYAQGTVLPDDVQTVRGESPSNASKVEVQVAPGSALAYSGGGYTVAEIALEDVFQQPFEALMRTWVLDPVGMAGATFSTPLPDARHASVAHGHDAQGHAVPGGWHNHPEQAAAGLWSRASDLARLLIELRRGYLGESAVFSQSLVRELLARPFEGHLYGFRMLVEGDDMFLLHNGGTVGYRARMAINLETGDGAVFLSSGDQGLTLAQELFAAVSRSYGWPLFREQRVTRARPELAQLQSLIGDYTFPEQGWHVSVALDADALTLVFPNGDRYVMAPIEGDTLAFIHPDTGVRASFVGDADGREIQLYGATGKRQQATK